MGALQGRGPVTLCLQAQQCHDQVSLSACPQATGTILASFQKMHIGQLWMAPNTQSADCHTVAIGLQTVRSCWIYVLETMIHMPNMAVCMSLLIVHKCGVLHTAVQLLCNA